MDWLLNLNLRVSTWYDYLDRLAKDWIPERFGLQKQPVLGTWAHAAAAVECKNVNVRTVEELCVCQIHKAVLIRPVW